MQIFRRHIRIMRLTVGMIIFEKLGPFKTKQQDQEGFPLMKLIFPLRNEVQRRGRLGRKMLSRNINPAAIVISLRDPGLRRTKKLKKQRQRIIEGRFKIISKIFDHILGHSQTQNFSSISVKLLHSVMAEPTLMNLLAE